MHRVFPVTSDARATKKLLDKIGAQYNKVYLSEVLSPTRHYNQADNEALIIDCTKVLQLISRYERNQSEPNDSIIEMKIDLYSFRGAAHKNLNHPEYIDDYSAVLRSAPDNVNALRELSQFGSTHQLDGAHSCCTLS